MTTIAAIRAGKYTYIAGEQQVTYDGGTKYLQRGPKVWIRFGLVWGCCGSLDWESAVVRAAPSRALAGDAGLWLADDWIAALRATWRECRVEGSEAGELLCGTRGRLWSIDDTLAPVELSSTYAATGSGGDVALGSLCETGGKPPDERLRRAIRAAKLWDSNSGGRITVRRA